ncbi:hypothetical protein AGMMS49957_03970 [Synergistales bacterium]|nr:hypothetical protein AGMMS49957_03970 [Synergistales bacterium]
MKEFEAKISCDLEAGVIRYEIPIEAYRDTAEYQIDAPLHGCYHNLNSHSSYLHIS